MNETWHQIKVRQQKERADILRNLAREGLTKTQAAARLGLHRQGLCNHVDRLGVEWENQL